MENISFWELITSSDIRKICIPTIQRDYALGRRDKMFNRQNFLTALKKAVCLNDNLPLDFVYGVENETVFIPLDGQQRLTTLWLLHWYVAYKAGMLNNKEIKKTMMKFSYETRISSTDFCKSLCNLEPQTCKKTLREWITQQTWFYNQYKQDPTIIGMLNMISGTEIKDKNNNDIIDGFEEVFLDDACDYSTMWKRLTTTKCIQFNKLEVNLEDSDELYIKMNARGKQLTDFENFKTELVQYVKDKNILNDMEALSFAGKLDVEWTDIFWPKRWVDSKTDDISIDEIYFTFINRYVRLECIKKHGDKSTYLKQITGSFTNFKPYEESLDKQSVLDLIKIMDNLRGIEFDTHSSWNEYFAFIPCYLNGQKDSISKIENVQILVFYGYLRYLLYGEYDEASFKEWNRVLWNICENRVDKSNFKPTISEIDVLAPHSHHIIDFLSQEDEITCEHNKKQLKEEQSKARQLQAHPSIREMEGYSFFKGTIRFLFTGADGNEDWGAFETKAKNIQELIPANKGRHTVSRFIDYLPFNALCDIYSNCWISNKDEYLRNILLYDNAIPYLHHFLLQDDKMADMTLLHQDIKDICETAFYGLGYLQTNWSDSKYIWTHYEKKSKKHSWNSFVVGNENYAKLSKMIDASELFEIQVDQRNENNRIGKHIQASYLKFKYQEHFLTLYGNNTICLMIDNWEEKMPNPDNSFGYYFPIEGIDTEDQLVKQINAKILEYSKMDSKNIDKVSDE